MAIDLDPAIIFSLLVFFVIIPFWFTRVIKGTLFYVYLWQLKEYRLERLIDHFRTKKGKELVLNKLLLVKVVLFILGIPLLILTVYGAESVKFIYDILHRRVRGPVGTKKAKALFVFNIGVLVIVLALVFKNIGIGVVSPTNGLRILILADILLPIIISLVVIALQPGTIFIRNRRLAAAKAKREKFPNLKVVGITGSYGKTSTKEFLAHILSAKFTVLKTPEHQNSEFGVANTILNKLTAEHQVFVCEMGAYKKGEIAALAKVAQPHIGIVTGVNEQHLATFGSMENLLSAEGGKELVDLLPEQGAAFINEKVQKRGVGYDANCTVSFYGKAENINIEKDHVSFVFQGTPFNVPAYGGHNIENLVGAIVAARELGMSLEEIAKAAATMPLELSPLKIKKTQNGTTVIDSTYSANPDGVIADLEYLSLYEGKKVLIMPSLIELGSAAKEAHKKIGEKIGQVCDLAIITTKEHFEDIKRGTVNREQVIYTENAKEIIEKVKDADAILLESRLPESLVKAIEHD